MVVVLGKKKDKSCNRFKFVLVLLSASVERVGVSCMRDFFQGISRRKLLGPYRNFLTIVKNFKKFKSSKEGKNAFFSVFHFCILDRYP